MNMDVVQELEPVHREREVDGNPKVSIVIPFFNCAYIDQAIESALNQSYTDIEVIVVNDGSTKHTDKIKPYLNKIRYIEKTNGGTASALNTGIRKATGDYFTWLSSDDIYCPGKVAKQLFFMRKENADISYSSYVLINPNNEVISGSAGIGFPTMLPFCEMMQTGCIINGCTIMMCTRVFSDIGLFDESLPYTHDYDFWLRALTKYSFHYLDEPLMYYRVHEQMGSKKFAQQIPQEIEFVQQKHQSALEKVIRRLRG